MGSKEPEEDLEEDLEEPEEPERSVEIGPPGKERESA